MNRHLESSETDAPHGLHRRGCWRVALVLLVLALPIACHAVRPPVLFLYGFQPVPGFYAPFLWEEFAEYLSGRSLSEIERVSISSGHSLYLLPASDRMHRDVVIGDYSFAFEPTVRDLRLYAERLSEEIAWVTAVSGADRVDLIAHSMGGLVARCYIEASDFEGVLGETGFPDYGTAYRDDVRVLVTLATPHYGAAFAAVGPWYGALAQQLPPDSRLLELLNRENAEGTSLPRSIRYVSMAGQSCLGCGLSRDEAACLNACAEEGIAWEGSDLVVLMSSARLQEGENVACIGINHVEMHMNIRVAETIAAILDGESAPTAIFETPEHVPDSSGQANE